MITTHKTKTRLVAESVELINDDEHLGDAVVYPVSRHRPRAIRPVRYRFGVRTRDAETHDERRKQLVTAGPGVVPDAEAPNGPGVRVVSTHPVPPRKTPRRGDPGRRKPPRIGGAAILG